DFSELISWARRCQKHFKEGVSEQARGRRFRPFFHDYILLRRNKMKKLLLILTLAAASMQMGFAQDSLSPYLSSLTPATENNAANLSAFIQGFGGGYNPNIVSIPTPSTPMAVAPITATSAPTQTAASWSLPASVVRS